MIIVQHILTSLLQNLFFFCSCRFIFYNSFTLNRLRYEPKPYNFFPVHYVLLSQISHSLFVDNPAKLQIEASQQQLFCEKKHEIRKRRTTNVTTKQPANMKMG